MADRTSRKDPTPIAVRRAVRHVGAHLGAWRRLRGLTLAQVAERAGLSAGTVSKLEAGHGGTSLENTLRVARALGIMDDLVVALDPYETDLGRLRADERLPIRVRPRRGEKAG